MIMPARQPENRAGAYGTTKSVAVGGVLGIVEWFRVGERERVEQVLADMSELQLKHLRTGVSWADWHTPEGPAWYGWLLPRLSREVHVLPCVVHTPPSLGIAPSIAAPPRDPKAYADFIDELIACNGACFDHIELWSEPDRLGMWDVRLDRGGEKFAAMIRNAAHWARRQGKKTVLAARRLLDPQWIIRMIDLGVMEHIDVVGVHRSLRDPRDAGQDALDDLHSIQQLLHERGLHPRIWTTQADYSTWAFDETGQLTAFLNLLREPFERIYWASMRDLPPDQVTIDGFHMDETAYHLGLKHADGRPKLLCRLWSTARQTCAQAHPSNNGSGSNGHTKNGDLRGNPSQLRLDHLFRCMAHSPWRSGATSYVLVTGGAGFIGTNVADRLLRSGRRVLLYDNLSRAGVEQNYQWLKEQHGENVQIEVADIRDRHRLRTALRHAEQVFHFAAQVAVTTSLKNPLHDFEVNANGTLNLLEEMRLMKSSAPLLFTSTNKVYGALDDLALRRGSAAANADDVTRYEPVDPEIRAHGVGETRPLDFHSPYGCSKGVADQAVHDFARSFGLKTVVFRMSCIYGPHQFGTEDQGWVAHFLLRARSGGPILLYGDGLQVRDILYVEDLVQAMLLAQERIDEIGGRAFNIGGGPTNVASLVELISIIEQLANRSIEVRFGPWRTADQRYYVSDTRQFERLSGWSPRVNVRQGVELLWQWLGSQRAADEFAPPRSVRRAGHGALTSGD